MYHPERFKELLLKRNTPEFLSPQKSLVFVYGSLKRGHHNDYIMQGAEFICHTMTKGGNFKMVGMKGGYPGITWGSFRIVGEVYAVSDLHLELLDCLEDEGYRDDEQTRGSNADSRLNESVQDDDREREH